MRKLLLVAGILILVAAAVIIVMMQTHIFSPSPALSDGAAASFYPSAAPLASTGTGLKENMMPSPPIATAKQTPQGEIETAFVKPVDFTQGVWIKKYPGNYACFKFETPEGIKIVTDPFYMSESVHPDIVTESHQHIDHNDAHRLSGDYKLITEDGKYDVKGIKIIGYPGKHNSGDRDTTNYIFVFDIGGIRLAHFASQGELPDKQALARIGKVDILLIQVFEPGAAKLTLKDCIQIIAALKPKIVIPEHGMANATLAFAKNYQVPGEYAGTGEIYITRHDLDAIKGIKIIDLDTPE